MSFLRHSVVSLCIELYFGVILKCVCFAFVMISVGDVFLSMVDCSRVAMDDPFLCLDLCYISALLLEGFGFNQSSTLLVHMTWLFRSFVFVRILCRTCSIELFSGE